MTLHRRQEERLRRLFGGKTITELRSMWDRWDGVEPVDGYAGEDIHAYLNILGDGEYCAV
jgi:hypothetical protein